MPNPSRSRSVPERFLVAFSLAGENRELVRPVAEAVEQELGESTVFYDEWYEHDITGFDGDLLLQGIYADRCAMAVVCVSAQYGGKPWTKIEHRAIRARYSKAQDEDDRRSILLLRVGDGDVPGVLSIDIAKDIRPMNATEAAKLIVDRLRLIVPDGDPVVPAGPDWPEQPPELSWPMANHGEVREAFGRLLCRSSAVRFLPVEGLSETGKTVMTRQMVRNALRIPDLACGRFDFKGTASLNNEVRAFAQQLGVEEPPDNQPISSRLGRIYYGLKQKSRPALLVFDTYELAGEAMDWLENQLLVSLVREPWLRVAVVGQRAPKRTGSSWEDISAQVHTLQAPPPEDWYAFGKEHKPDITLDLVRQVHELCNGKPSVLAELLGPAR